MKSSRMKILPLVFLLVALLVGRGASNQKLVLEEIFKLTLSPNSPQKYDVIITEQIQPDSQLYITAQSPFSDPFQVPEMQITSQDGNYSQTCFDAVSEYAEICAIPSEQLKKDRKFTVKVECVVKCDLQISAYIDNVVKFELNDRLLIKAMKDFGISNILELKIPQDAKFTQVVIEAKISNVDEVNQGLQMKVNYGKGDKVAVPTLTNYKVSAESEWDDGMEITISKEQLSPGDMVKVLIYLPPKMQVKFTCYLINGNNFTIELNKDVRDYISAGENRLYVLDLKDSLDKIKDDDIDVTFDIYSGSPEIQIAFDAEFSADKTVSKNYLQGKVNSLLTPQVRQEFGFTDKVYIRVSGYFTSAFVLSTSLNKKDFVPLFLQTSQISMLAGDQVYNYIYEEKMIIAQNATDLQTTQSYTVKIEMVHGAASFGIRRCKSLQVNNTMDCLIKDKKTLTNDPELKKTFDEIDITVEQSFQTYDIQFSFNFKKCSKKAIQGTGDVAYHCVFQLFAMVNTGSSSTTTLSTTLYKREYSALLKEGQITRGTIGKDDYSFYVFILPVKEDIQEIAFFLTTIQGDVLFLGSKSTKYPTLLQLAQKDIQIASKNSIIYKSNFSSTYYLSIYGYQKSDFTITVAIIRKNVAQEKNGTEVLTEISLTESTVQSYTLGVGQFRMLFGFYPKPNSTVEVTVSSIQGVIEFKVVVSRSTADTKTNQSEDVTCEVPGSPTCKFLTKKGDKEKYQVVVFAAPNETEVFNILYRYPDNNSCVQYPMNSPMIITLKANQQVCTQYNIKEPKQLELVVSISTFDLLQGAIKASIMINKANLPVDSHHIKISKAQLSTFCKIDQIGKLTNQTFKICKVIVNFTTTIDTQFQAILEDTSISSALFDGIPQKVVTKQISQTLAKRFYYDVHKISNIRVFISSETALKYLFAIRILNSSDYVASKDNKFPLFNDTESDNTLIRHSRSGVHLTQIPTDRIKITNCTDCVLLISVYLEERNDKNSLSAFSIEVSQVESNLKVGQTKRGYVEEQQFFNYDITTYGIDGGIFTLSFINNDNCAEILVLDQQQHKIDKLRSFALLSKPDTDYRVIVHGLEDCQYNAAFTTEKNPLVQIRHSYSYGFSLENNGTQYMLYYHKSNTSLRIIETIQTGDASLFAEPLNIGKADKAGDSAKKIDSLIRDNANLTFGGQYGDIDIKNTHQKFCFDCYYLIAARSNPSAKLSVVIVYEDYPIPLYENSMLKDRVNESESAGRKYQYNSIDQFNVTINVLFGLVKVKITNPEGNTLYDVADVKNNKEFVVQDIGLEKDSYYDPYDETTRFLIEIIPQKDSGFTIEIKRRWINLKLISGLPYYLHFTQQNYNKTLEFINLDQSKENFTILYEINTSEVVSANIFKFKAWVEDTANDIGNPIQSITQSEQSFNLILKNVKGRYFIEISSPEKKQVNVTLILANSKMTHIMSSSTNLFHDTGIFEVYDSKEQAMMIEIFNCKGNLQIRAADKIDLLGTENAVIMEHGNYGGHYVVTAENQIGNIIFLETLKKNANDTESLYTITYSYYPSTKTSQGYSQMPYRLMNFDYSTIKFTESDDSKIFILNPLVPKDEGSYMKVKSIVYTLIISAQQKYIQSFSQCSIGEVLQRVQTVAQNFSAPIQLQMTFDDLEQYLGSDNSTYFVGAVATVLLNFTEEKNYYSKELNFIYETAEMTERRAKPGDPATNSNIRQIIIWIVFPFLIAAFFLMVACRYCLKRLYGNYFPTTLVEEDDNQGPTQDAIKNASGGSGNFGSQNVET